MSTTTTPAGWIIPAAQLGWDRLDWIEAYQHAGEDTYASSVIWATDGRGLLALSDLEQLLRHHGASLEQLEESLAEGMAQGAAVLPLTHGGQALAWLGY